MSRAGFRTCLPPAAYLIQGSGAGSPTINGASQTGNTLSTAGWTVSSTNVLMVGDLFSVKAGTVGFNTAPANGAAITFEDYYGNSYSIGTGNGSATNFTLPSTFFTGYSIYVAGTLNTSNIPTMQHQLLRVVKSNVSSNSSGDATITFEPSLRFSPDNSSPLSLTNVSACFSFAKPDSSMSYTAPRMAALSLALVEDITL